MLFMKVEKVTGKDLLAGLDDVLKRRGLAYRTTPNLNDHFSSKNSEVYTV